MRRHNSLLFIVITLALQATALIHSPPRIIKQPPRDEILFKVVQKKSTDDKKPFFIECEAEGEPAPKYRWIKNGKRFDWQAYDNRMSQQHGRGTLVITQPLEEDIGQYQCFAENEHGIATTNSVFYRKAELNSFKDEPVRTIDANEGDPLKLQCQPPDGYPKPNVYWLIQNTDTSFTSINNSRITVDPEGNLWFSNVTRFDASDDFYYVCCANSEFLNEFKVGNKILLNVIQTGISPTQNRFAPERQYVTRKNEVAIRGNRAVLYCIFGGTPLPQIVWSKNGRPIPWSDRITQGNYGKSIIIKHTTFEDSGSYTCESSNGVGRAQSYSISLQILAFPYFTVEPEVQSAAVEETITLKCEASGVPEPTIKWIYNGKSIAEAPANDRRTVNTNSIIIKNIFKNDTGNYGCNATNSLGYVYKDVYLNVLEIAPEITEPPRAEETVDRRNVSLRCRVFGSPRPIVRWVHNNNILTGGRYSVQQNGDLLITEVTFADGGAYRCLAENKFGKTEANGSLTVMEHTRITDEPQDYEVAAGNPATFRCNAVADAGLALDIKWFSDDEEIDFEAEPRFVLSNDYSLTISKTTELDSGNYKCVGSTRLDEVSAQASLIVQDVPNPPLLQTIKCNAHDATITWKPLGDNRAPILHYTIQFNTSFTPDTWEVVSEKVPATDFTYTVPMSPWANYTFRVIAFNKIGPSIPSGHSEYCFTEPDVPTKNPENVEGKGSEPTNLIISWTHMPEIEHNGPNFYYKILWKRDIPAEKYNDEIIHDWHQSNIVIRDQPTFERYRIKVIAGNREGESNAAAVEVIGYSGEDIPLQAPTNFTMIQTTSSTSAVLSWNPVPLESIRGHFKGYKIQTWTEADGEDNYREIHIKDDAVPHPKALVTKFAPNAKNFARVLVFNSRYNGPPSAIIDFQTPEGTPSTVQTFEAYPLGSSAFLLTWKKPLQPNGRLTGYKIYYEEIKGTSIGSRLEREPHITDPRINSAKLAGLKPDTKYRLHIMATTKAGEGETYFIEQKTLAGLSVVPDQPHFVWERLPTENGYAKIKIVWQPSVLQGNPGSHFFAKYRIQGKTQWEQTDTEKSENFLIVHGLEPEASYEFSVVSVDGDYYAESPSQIVTTFGVDGPVKVPSENVATAGWFIGMMLAIAFLLLLLIIICIIKRNRGGKYDVHDREMANGRRDYPEDAGGFHEYSQPLDNKSAGRQSVASNNTKPEGESDADSMAEYGEGDTGQFTEDGSFIGQYVPGKLQPPVSPQPLPHIIPSLQQQPQQQQSGVGAVATYV